MAAPIVSASTDDDGRRLYASVSAALQQYSDWGWLTVPVGSRVLLTADWSISALEMPSDLCHRLARYLNARMLGGPVIELPGQPRRSLMLTSSADEAAPVDLARLRARDVCAHRRGALVPLPPTHLENGYVRWLATPTSGRPVLAPFSATVAAVCAITEPAQDKR